MRILLALLVSAVFASSALGHRASSQQARVPRSAMVLPGEFEPVDRMLVAWDDALAAFLADVVAAARSEVHVTILHPPNRDRATLDRYLRRIERARKIAELEAARDAARYGRPAPRRWMGRIEVIRLPVDAIWIRDFGPLPVRGRRGARALIDFDYFDGGENDEVPARLGRRLWPGWAVRRVPLELEGGNVLSDGRGRCITSAGYSADESSADEDEDWDTVSSTIDVDELRRVLRQFLGCRQLYVLPPLRGEATGHVDMFATITAPGEVIVGAYEGIDDPFNAARLNRSAAVLTTAGFRVRRIPMPGNGDGRFRSYTNAIAINGAVLVPVYRDDRRGEARALSVFREAYPDRAIVPIESSEVIQLDGAVHCATMTIARD